MNPTMLARAMAALEAVESAPGEAPPAGKPAKVGVDLGTACTVLVALDRDDRPLALAHEAATWSATGWSPTSSVPSTSCAA